MKRIETIGAVVVLAALGATACASGPRTPDEFRVVRKAPLTVPPEYNLRPPTPGAARPQELQPDQQARVAVFGSDIGREASEGEKAFITAAGADAIDRTVRAQVDFDSSQILRKNRSFADAILNFGKGSGEPVVDASAEAERLKAEEESLKEVTGGGTVLIRKKNTSKLPGL
ncbi:MAG TPA: DUF3035 domain-containing protein [Hyphomonadaceae bacterium]|nr:DUF3035 domain-containing protein [Hyphomonadaceae bacterium]